MKCNKFLRLIFCFAILFCTPAHAQTNFTDAEAKEWALDKGNMLLDAFAEKDIQKKFDTLDYMFLNYVDLDYISKFVVGKYWRKFTPEQRTKFQSLFKRYALGVYKEFPLTFKNRINYEITNVVTKDNFKDVTASIDVKELTKDSLSEVLVVFRLEKKEKDIKIIDIKIAESSLILSYRNQFTKMIMDTDEDLDWFMEDFEVTVISTEAANKIKLEDAFREGNGEPEANIVVN